MQGRQIEVRRRKLPYTNVKNDLIWDSRLRLQTRFALIAMLSLPDDWDYSIRGMAAKLEVSKDTMAKMLKELEEAGYLRRQTQEHAASGQFGRARYILTDVPNDFGGGEEPEDEADSPDRPEGESGAPCPDLPYTVSPYTKNSPQQNNKEQTNKQIPLKPPLGGGGQKETKRGRSRKAKELDPEARAMLNRYVAGDPELTEAMQALMEVRQAPRSKAVNTARAIKTLLTELDKLSAGDRDTKLRIIRQSVMAGWAGLFPLRGGQAPAQARKETRHVE